MSYLFATAKFFVEKMINEGKDLSEIEFYLKNKPFVDGTFRIDTLLFSNTISSIYLPVDDKLTFPRYYFRLYLGAKNLWERGKENLQELITLLNRIRRVTFAEKLIYDIEELDLSSEPYKELKTLNPVIPFKILLIEPEDQTVKAFLFHTGYLAAEPEIFEKVGKYVYGLRKGEIYEEEISKPLKDRLWS
ncbi:MAG: hypothetical protein QW412_00850 [Candidatus Aenigmatarchaeota archaeon]